MCNNVVNNPFDFIFGGNANFTIANNNTNISYKYRVNVCKNNEHMFFVKVKIDGNYVYAGYIMKINDSTFIYHTGKKGNMTRNDPAIKGIIYAIKNGNKPLNAPMVMMHHGKCARCGKKLDDDISVSRGFGPHCYKEIHSFLKEV